VTQDLEALGEKKKKKATATTKSHAAGGSY